jgi:hypothetical protein
METVCPVVLIEFNELSPILVDRFVKQGKLPNFERFRSESQVFVTEADERAPYLEPWIQWITVHSGLNYREHGIFKLGDGHLLDEQCVWDVLSEAGFRVWVCGSMNIRFDRPLRGWVLPDPWATEVQPYPNELFPYFNFVQRNVVEYTKDRVPLTLADFVRFIRFMLGHGLSASTVRRIVQQLVGERIGTRMRWRRAVLLDRLQFDLFRSHYCDHKPDFSTYFVNSTAHFQHFYWRNLQPELFKVKPSAADQAQFQDAVLFGYQQMDQLLDEFIALAGEDATLILCTALSQQPCLKYEEEGGKVVYRPRDFNAFLDFAGIRGRFKIAPIMAEEFLVYFDSEACACEAEQRLLSLQVEKRPAMAITREARILSCNCRIVTKLPQDAILHAAYGKRSTPFFDIFYQIEGIKSGMHHPDGMLWIRTRDRRQKINAEKLPLDAVAPMILEMFGVQTPRSKVSRAAHYRFGGNTVVTSPVKIAH